MAAPPPSANPLPRWRLALAALPALVGALYLASEIGALPHYHDSNAYFELARLLRVDAHRGIAYPAFLAGVDAIERGLGGDGLLRVVPNEHPGAPCTAPEGIWLVQLAQLGLCAGALLYWLRSVGIATGSGTRDLRHGALGVTAIVLLDPLVGHFALSVMPDALAMAASLVFCGALARLASPSRASRATPAAGAWLLAAFTAAALLRPEKKYVLLCVVAASAAVWLLAARRQAAGAADARSPLPRRVALAVALVAAGLAAAVAVERTVHRDYGRPGQGTIIAHARGIFPHLGDIADALPEDVRARFSEDDIAFYDKHVLNPGPVMERASGGDDEEAARLTDAMLRTALRERGAAIAFDVAKDTLENALPTLGLYPRTLALELLGMPGYRRVSRSDMLPWTHKLMTEHHPALAHASTAVSGVAFTFALATAVVAWRRRPRAASDDGAGRPAPCWWPWVPSIAFALANGAAFALHADAVSPRYTIASHAMLIAAVYAAVLGQLDGRSVPD